VIKVKCVVFDNAVNCRDTAASMADKSSNYSTFKSSLFLHTATIPKNGEGQVIPVHIMKVYRERRGIAPLILNLRTRWRHMFTHQLLYRQEKSPQYPLNKRVCGPQSPSRHF
jgi:hypothetical protein